MYCEIEICHSFEALPPAGEGATPAGCSAKADAETVDHASRVPTSEILCMKRSCPPKVAGGVKV